MNYDILFAERDEYSEIFGERVLLRELTDADVPKLFEMIQDKDIINFYSINGEFKSITQVYDYFIIASQRRFIEKNLIVWAIEDIDSSQLIGIRECYIDNDYSPVVIQGFTGKQHRGKGYTAEAYRLIIKFLEDAYVEVIESNISIENFSAAAMLSSVGFKHKAIQRGDKGVRIIFKRDSNLLHRGLEFNGATVEATGTLRTVLIFSLMYLNAYRIRILSTQVANSIDNALPSKIIYELEIYAQNTYDQPSQHPISFGHFTRSSSRKLKFYSDGISVGALGDKRHEYIDGTMRYEKAWQFCWENCQVHW